MATRRAVAALALLALVPAAMASPEKRGVLRGIYVAVDGQAYVEPCGRSERLRLGGPAATELAAAYAQLATAEHRRLYVEVRGSHARNSFTADQVERIQVSGEGCHEVMRNSLFKAYGALPEWNLFIDPTGLRLRTLEDGGPIWFPYHRFWREGGAWVFGSHNNGGDIRVEVRHGRCIDPATGNRFGFTAAVVFGEKRYSGCAYPGDLLR